MTNENTTARMVTSVTHLARFLVQEDVSIDTEEKLIKVIEMVKRLSPVFAQTDTEEVAVSLRYYFRMRFNPEGTFHVRSRHAQSDYYQVVYFDTEKEATKYAKLNTKHGAINSSEAQVYKDKDVLVTMYQNKNGKAVKVAVK